VYLRGCSNITDEAVANLAENCKHIDEVDLRGCSKITDAGVKKLGTKLLEPKLLEPSLSQTCVFSKPSKSGVIKKFFEDKGFGFIIPDEGGDDVFVHVKDNPDLEGCQAGDAVLFESQWDDRKGKYKGVNLSVKSDGGGGGGGGSRALKDWKR